MGGTEESRMEGEMDWSYLGRPAGTDESMWCMMGASPIRQPITDFGLNGITNHGHWLASSFPISDKPQHIVSILQAASCPVYVVSLYVYCTIHVCVCACVCVRVCWCLWLYSDSTTSILDIHICENSGVAVDLFYCSVIASQRSTEWTKNSSRLFNLSLHCAG